MLTNTHSNLHKRKIYFLFNQKVIALIEILSSTLADTKLYLFLISQKPTPVLM